MADDPASDQTPPDQNQRVRIRREAMGLFARLVTRPLDRLFGAMGARFGDRFTPWTTRIAELWRGYALVRFGGWALGALLALYLLVWVTVARNLPSADGKYSLYCAVIVKRVDEKTRSKTSINELLRD